MKYRTIITLAAMILLAGCQTLSRYDFEKKKEIVEDKKPLFSKRAKPEPAPQPGVALEQPGGGLLEEKIQPTEEGTITKEEGVVVVEKIVFVERPIYYPVDKAKPATGEDAVRAATKTSQMLPEIYNGRIIFYDYDETVTYHIYCQPLRITDIYLEPGETLIEEPVIGDSTRWIIGFGKSKEGGEEVQHIYLKPTMAGLETTITINTTKRIYYMLIKSFQDVYMAGVRFRYPMTGMPKSIVQGKKEDGTPIKTVNLGNEKLKIDPSLISTDYIMKYNKKTAPPWLPTLVLDDGAKTYIYMPENVAFHEIPAVHAEGMEIVNYRLLGNVIVIDRLVKTITMKLRDITVTINKKER